MGFGWHGAERGVPARLERKQRMGIRRGQYWQAREADVMKITIDSFEVNPKVDPDIFKKPAQ